MYYWNLFCHSELEYESIKLNCLSFFFLFICEVKRKKKNEKERESTPLFPTSSQRFNSPVRPFIFLGFAQFL